MKNNNVKQLTALVIAMLVLASGLAFGQGSTLSQDSTQKRGTLRSLDTARSYMQQPSHGMMYDSVQGSTSSRDSARGYGLRDTVPGYGMQGTVQGSSGRRDSLGRATDESREPDNTGVNKRDRNDEEMTADEQGQSAEDIETTRQIRRAIMEDDSLSTYAKNVKIITREGLVTLKGPVRSQQEKSTIEAKAVAVAGAAKVKNQMEVKAADPSQE